MLRSSKKKWISNFNPLPPCGGRRLSTSLISTKSNFNPLPPCGGRPNTINPHSPYYNISIHSLRVEGDGSLAKVAFSPLLFQSTPSVWRETGVL